MLWPLSRMLVVAFVATSAAGAQSRDPLERARVLYNQRQFDEAIAAADEARRTPDKADAAALIAARAYLERFRSTAAPEDLTTARERLRTINASRFTPRERVEFIVGLGETLYFDEATGAAAEMFESALVARGELSSEARDRVLDWWATALDRGARARPEIERQSIYQKLRDRMADELSVNPASGAASYWAAAAARGQGDLQAAWDAALAGWVRAQLAQEQSKLRRDDLDTLVQRAIIPERARLIAKPPDALLSEWESFKAQWDNGAR
jgi:hypothetical protein